MKGFFKEGGYDNMAHALDFLPGVLSDNTVAILYGPPQSGKTFVALHMLCCAALGRSWFGDETPTKKRHGLYLALEGEAGVKCRIKAWVGAHRAETNPIHYRLGAFHLTDEKAVAGLIDYMDEHDIGFVVIDTLSLAVAGLDELSGHAMSHVLETLHRIKREANACVLAIAHTGKNEKAGIRGHSSQTGNVDTTIEIVAHNKVKVDGRIIEHPITLATPRSIVVRKQRDGQADRTWPFHLELKETDITDARGRVVTSPALVEGRDPRFEDVSKQESVPTPDEQASAVLTRLIGVHEIMGQGVTLEDYRKALKRAGWRKDDKPTTWRSAWKRLSEKLVLDSSEEIEP